MADVKRRFYNTGDAKGFTRKDFFAAVQKMAGGEELDEALIDLVAKAAAYELEGLANKATKSNGEKKDPLDSDYAVALRAAIVPLLSTTPKTGQELIDEATAAGNLSPKGTPFAAPWVARVLKGVALKGECEIVKQIVEKTDSKGLKKQTEVNAYKLA